MIQSKIIAKKKKKKNYTENSSNDYVMLTRDISHYFIYTCSYIASSCCCFLPVFTFVNVLYGSIN